MNKRSFFWVGLAAIIAAGGYLLFSPTARHPESGPNPPSVKTAALSQPAPRNAPAPVVGQGTNATVGATTPALSREMDPTLNPYAAALRGPGKSKRDWDPEFINQYKNAAEGDPIRFELTDGRVAEGTIKLTQKRDGELTYLSGELTLPQQGKFFFLTPPPGSPAGRAVGVIELAGSPTAYRIEPTGIGREPELWERQLGEVICLDMPHVQETPQAAAATTDPEPENMPPLRPDLVPNYVPSYNSNIISLQSYPGSPAVLLLDFFGGYTPTWGGVTYPAPNVSNDAIKDLWKRVAEDFMPFNINVTTDIKVYQNAPAGSRQRCAFTIASSKNPLGDGGAGIAYIGSWNWGSDTPCWSGYTTGKSGAEVGAHEPGHTLGLSHEGTDINGTHTEYYAGQGSGATGWAPIMGAGYYQPVVTWSKGDYAHPSNLQDQLKMIVTQNTNVTYRADDTGSTLATSRYLEVNANNTATAEGVIETTGDTDAFQFTTAGGQISLTANPVGDWANLAIFATLCDATDTVIASNNPQTTLSATISRSVPAGTYTFRVTGTGRNDPLVGGFSSYASLGYYSISGTVQAARLPNRFSIAENSPVGLVVGTIPGPTSNTNGDVLTYNITAGNTGGTFAMSNNVLVLADNTLLNYETLALGSQSPVQFEMFVDIIDSTTPSVTETKRRVVVAITNVNETPVLAGFTASVLEHTQPGAVVGVMGGSDPDFYTILRYSILSGNSNSMFAIDSATGAVSVAGDLSATNQSLYNLLVQVSDQTPPSPLLATSMVTITVVSNTTAFRPGSVAYAVYTNISGTLVSALTSASVYPYNPAFEKQLAQTEADSNWGQNYGGVMRGYLIPPTTGNYTFWIATDDNGELWLSSTANPANISRRAYISGDGNFAGIREWTKFASQQSAPISLNAGQAYYFEARFKQGTGGDNFAVAWQCPEAGITRDVIPGRFLAPYPVNYTPRATGFARSVHRDALAGSRVGTVGMTDVNANDLHTFTIVSGNGSGIFGIDATNGTIRVVNDTLLAGSAQSSYTLLIGVTDNGSPSRGTTATVTLNLVATNAVTSTSIRQEIWTNITDTTVTALTSVAAYPKRPDVLRALTGMDTGSASFADNYGSRIRALLTAPTNGAYKFYISSDDNSQLKFSMTTNPATATVIASVSDYSDYQQWTKFASQTSASISLVAGKQYYIEALHKEGSGGDHVEVAWMPPGATNPVVIPSSYLSPVDLNFAPEMVTKSIFVPANATNGTVLAGITATDSAADTLIYKVLSGNSSGTFAINPDTGALTVVDNTAIVGRLTASFSLKIQAQDSGYGDLFPRKSTNANLSVVIVEPTAVVWTGNAADNNWSSGANWNGVAPMESTPLTFAGANRRTNVNDLLSLAGAVKLQNSGFQISGRPLTLRLGLTSLGDNTWAIDTILSKPESINDASGTLVFSGALSGGDNMFALTAYDTLYMQGAVSGTGAMTIDGTGLVIMSAANPFSGAVTVSSGTLVLTNGGSLASASLLDINLGGTLDVSPQAGAFGIGSSQTLAGEGAVIGDLAVQGTLAPGDPVGTLVFSNNLVLAGVTQLEFNKSDSGLINDMISVAGTLQLGGSLVLTNSGGPLAVGDSLHLFSASTTTGAFAGMDLPAPGPGLSWNTSSLLVDGTIRVEAAKLRVGIAWLNGGGLALSLQTAPGVTYVVQTAPDLQAPIQWSGLSTNVGDGTALTIPAPAGAQETQRFYRILSY